MRAGPFRWGVALATLALAIGVLALPVGAQTVGPDLTCPFTEGIVVDLGSQMIRSDLTMADAETGPVTVSIPAGSYDVYLRSYDPHDSTSPQSQANEQWRLADVSMVSGVTPTFLSGIIDDLPDSEDYLSQQVNSNVHVPALTQLWAWHAAYPTSGDPETYANSIHPVCAAFVPVTPPTSSTTTTQATTTTTQATTTTASPLLGSIGDFVWNDANDNGVQDADEVGIADVTVNLYNGAGNLLTSTVTDADGHYRFGGLVSGDYVVEFVLPTTAWEFSPADQGSNDALDSDPGADGRTGIITLAGGAGDLTNDAGMYFPAQVEPTTAVRPTQETLPFTGGSSSTAGGVGIGLILLGGLILLVLRKEPVDG